MLTVLGVMMGIDIVSLSTLLKTMS
jgi:hypothetical protein